MIVIYNKGKVMDKSRQLDAAGKVKLILWLSRHQDECEQKTAEEIATILSAEGDVNISGSSVQTYRLQVYPHLRRKRKSKGVENCHDSMMIQQLLNHAARLEAIEQKMKESGM